MQNIKSKPKSKENQNQQSTKQLFICACVIADHCAQLSYTVQHRTVLSPDNNLLSYPPDNHHCSDVVYCRGRGTR